MNAIPTCQYYTPLSTYDLWVSMIENWGEANKEYKHCKLISVAECLMKMSKYLSRMFNAMRVILRSRVPKEDRKGLLDFGTTDDPEFVTDLLLRYKKSGKKLSPAAYHFVRFFWISSNVVFQVECIRIFCGIVWKKSIMRWMPTTKSWLPMWTRQRIWSCLNPRL